MDREKLAVRQVPISQLTNIIKSHSPQGLFMSKSGFKWIAVDNSNFKAWTEEFTCKFQAICWLCGEFEVESRIGKVYTVIHTATDNDKCRFVSPTTMGSYVSHHAALEEMERQIAKEKAGLDERYDQEGRGTDLWEMCQRGNETACFSRIEILETKLQYGTETWSLHHRLCTRKTYQGSGIMRILVVEPGKEPGTQEIDGALSNMQKLVGGRIEAIYPYDEPVALVANDGGKLLGLPMNRGLRDESGKIYDIVCGTFFLCGLAEESFTSLTDEQVEKFKRVFAVPDVFLPIEGGVLILSAEKGEDDEG